MVIVTHTHAVRPPQERAQSAHESRDQQQNQHTTADPTVRARQRHVHVEIRRAKETARCRDHEFIVRRADGDERAGPGTGDRREEVV